MKANELRIGNLYRPTNKIAESLMVTPDDLKAWYNGAVYGRPIPLTEDWLIKFGFENWGASDVSGEDIRYVLHNVLFARMAV